MSRRHAVPLLAVLPLLLPLCHAAAQGPATVDLGKRIAKSRYALGAVTSLRELADGSLLVLDIKEGVVRRVDLNKGAVTVFGHQGDDEGDYRRATRLYDLAGDSVGVYDAAGQKLMHVSPQGSIGAMTPMPGAAQRIFPVALDAAGNVYSRATVRDSVTHQGSYEGQLSRLAPGGTTPEPIFSYHVRAKDQAGTLNPFLYADAIAIRGDGLAARVVADTYQVVWYRDGKEVGRSGPIAYEPIVISTAETQAIKDSLTQMFKGLATSVGSNGGKVMTLGGGPGVSFGGPVGGKAAAEGSAAGGTNMTFTMARPAGGGDPVVTNTTPGINGANVANTAMTKFDPEQMLGVFPAAKPPITGSNAAMFDADGHLWVARSNTRGDIVPHYDVFGAEHGLVARVNLPAGTRLAGFGKGAVYLARADEGSDWIERYAMPKM